jgi:histidinol-phosphate/aromatic aminotransferase/cobyric acid decarboxylase-like protein/choline kinase
VQGLILAAGLGRRLGELTRDRTKAMLPVGGRPLLHRALDALVDAGVSRVVVVTGHAAAGLREAIGPSHRGASIAYVDNPVYADTNNIYSLWLARDALAADDTLLLESDLIFEPELIADVLGDPAPNLAVVARFEPWMDGTVTLLDDASDIVSLIPRSAFDWGDADRYYKTVNIYKFSRGFSRDFYLPFLEAYIRVFGRSRFYEQVLAVITYLSKSELRAHRTSRRWYEIDDVEDLRTAETLFAPGPDRLASYARRHGGYWRFPRLLDACYLVNPFFPTPRVLEELRARFDSLVGAYPSGLDVQCELASRIYPVRPAQVVVGNGASELIRALRRALPGPWGVPLPTFEEYRAASATVALRLPPPEFGTDVASLAELARGVAVLVLVNPNNPTGRYLEPRFVRELLERTARLGVRLLVDESFVDFAGGATEPSLLETSLLESHPHLVVVRSLGKSHGVAGLRLGLAASGDTGLMRALRAELPIWNVGSLAEAFLQIAPRHAEAYRESCRRLGQERGRLFERLAELPRLRPFASHANFVLCDLGVEATGLARALAERHEILIKDCTGKAGLETGQFVRIAVRRPEENDRILAALREESR